MSDQVEERLRDLERELAVTHAELEHLKTKVNSFNNGVNRGLWILGGGFIAGFATWVMGGGFLR